MSPGLGRRARMSALVAAALLLAVSFVCLQRPLSAAAQATARRPVGHGDWVHVFRVIDALKARLPKVPVVYLLGGSAARESTINDKNWAAQVRRLGHRRVRAFNLGSNNQTYAQGITVVNDLPAVPSIVLIGVNLGRYTATPVNVATKGGEQPIADPGGRPDAGRSAGRYYDQHEYSVAEILTDAQKRASVRWWLADRYPFFKENFAGNTAELEQLIEACQARGLHPVLLELPLNLPIVRHAFDKPRKRYRNSCRALAKKYGIPKIDFLRKAGLVSGDFYDLFHIVEPGRVKWQLQLSKTVVSLLERYDMGKN